MNRSYGSTVYDPSFSKAVQYLKNQSVDVVLSTGDMVAGQKSGLDYDKMWEAFHNISTRQLEKSSIPFLPSPGNHDASAGSAFKNEREKYSQTWRDFRIDRFNSLKASDKQIKFIGGVAQNYPLNYAAEMGPLVFIALDATVPRGLINRQLEWLEDVLRKTSNYPVKIVFGHLPLYPFAFHRVHESLAQGTQINKFYQKLENMLEQYKVQLFLSGHHHVYYPGRRKGSVRYISVPLLGSGARQLLTADRSYSALSSQGFLSIQVDPQFNVAVESLRTSDLKPIAKSDLPPQISVPDKEATDCRGCKDFPVDFFLDTGRRILYYLQ
jgi:3',5'-cyclic AMP phosphodiesterase CpdA